MQYKLRDQKDNAKPSLSNIFLPLLLKKFSLNQDFP